jgi:hypothetical protein
MVDLPRNGFIQPVEVVGGGGGGVFVEITGILQVQNVETTTPLGAGATVNGASRDCEVYESFGISVYLDPAAGEALDASVVVENSIDGVTWREVDTVPISGAADATVQLNRVYSVTRQFYRVSVVNNDMSNAMDATEVVSMLKPV